MYSFQMALQIAAGEGDLDRQQLDFFLKGNLSLEKVTLSTPPALDARRAWHDIAVTSSRRRFAAPRRPAADSTDEWRSVVLLEALSRRQLRGEDDSERLSPLESMMVIGGVLAASTACTSRSPSL